MERDVLCRLIPHLVVLINYETRRVYVVLNSFTAFTFFFLSLYLCLFLYAIFSLVACVDVVVKRAIVWTMFKLLFCFTIVSLRWLSPSSIELFDSSSIRTIVSFFAFLFFFLMCYSFTLITVVVVVVKLMSLSGSNNRSIVIYNLFSLTFPLSIFNSTSLDRQCPMTNTRKHININTYILYICGALRMQAITEKF